MLASLLSEIGNLRPVSSMQYHSETAPKGFQTTQERLTMTYQLITDEEYASLPDDDDECFVRFESIYRGNMTQMIDKNNNLNFDQAVQQQYMAAVAAVAEECRIPNIHLRLDQERNFGEIFSHFSLAVQGEVARIRIRTRGSRNPYSVQLLPNTRSKIENYLDRIRDIVENSDMRLDRKNVLRSRLDDLAAELKHQRFGFAKAMAVLGAVLVGFASTTTISAEGPAAVNNIMKLISVEKDSEDSARLRLTPSPKALTGPPKKGDFAPNNQASPWEPSKHVVDDEIPF